jgi:hypothetical protein
MIIRESCAVPKYTSQLFGYFMSFLIVVWRSVFFLSMALLDTSTYCVFCLNDIDKLSLIL